MPAHPTCTDNQADVDLSPAVRWLCDESNRTGAGETFLNSVHDQFHRRGFITPRQEAAVLRWNHGQERASDLINVMDEDDEPVRPVPGIDLEDSTDEQMDDDDDDDDDTDYEYAASGIEDVPAPGQYEGPHEIVGRWDNSYSTRAARSNQAQWVYNGEFHIASPLGQLTKLRIATIAQSRTEDLVGKRAVYVYVAGRWTPFAFVTTTGHLQAWRAYQDDDNIFLRVAASNLLEHMRSDDIDTTYNGTWSSYEDDNGDSWDVRRLMVLCRNCNATLPEGEDAVNGRHDEDCSAQRVSAFASPARSVRRVRATYTPPAPQVASFVPEPTPVASQYSELGGGWLQ